MFESMKALNAKAEAENRDFNDSEKSQYSQYEADLGGLEERIDRARKLEDRERELKQYADEPIVGGSTEARSDGVARATADGSGGTRSQWEHIGEFLMAVAQAGITGRKDPRLVESRAATGMNETVPSDGGFLVDKAVMGGLMQRAFETSNLAKRARTIPIGEGKNGLTWYRLDDASRENGKRYGGIQAYWIGEGETIIPSRPRFKEATMKLKKLSAALYATEELLQDARALEGWVYEFFPQEMAFRIDDAILYGTGVGQPLGILNSKVPVTIAKESGQAAASVVYKNILKMEAAFLGAGGSSPVWFVNRNVKPQLAQMSMEVGTAGNGVPVYMPPNGAAQQQYSTLLGYPVIPIEHAQTVGTKGDIMLCDMKDYLLIEKGGVATDVSMHVEFLRGENVFKWTKRIDGMPMQETPVTPYKGAAGEKLSSFVLLDNRA